MIVILPIGKTRVEFESIIPFDDVDFEFIFHNEAGIFRNTQQIERQIRRVEEANNVNFIGKTRVEIGRVDFYLDLSMYFYPSAEVLAWRLRGREHLPRKYMALVDQYLLASRPVILGTGYSVMPELRGALKQEIYERAMRLSIRMRDNAEAIIRYIGQS